MAFLFKTIFGPTLASSCKFLRPLAIFSQFLPEKNPNMVCPYAPCWVLSLFCPFQPKIWPLGQLVWPNGYFHFITSVTIQPHSNNVPINRWPQIALIVIIQIFAHFGLFLGPWRAQVCETPCAQVGTEVSAHYGIRKNTIDDSNGPHSLNSYQISHCEMSELSKKFYTI